jgi:DNA-directed RNA polymerase subunit E'/Rpb7
MGDPLFERRVLTRNIHIDAKYLQRNIQASLLSQLRMKFEGICTVEGYIQRKSITIVENSLGRINLIKGGVDYAVQFQADVCMPHPGQVLEVPVTVKSKIGIHAEVTPLKVLLPRDLHIGNTDFEQVKDGQLIRFEVVGARFQQGDDSIVVLGKLMNIIKPDTTQPTEELAEFAPQLAPSEQSSSEDSAVRKVVVNTASVRPDGGARKAPRQMKLAKP